MFKVEVKGINQTLAHLAGMGKQVRYAASRALNTAAFEAMREGQRQIEGALDKPTRWTLKSWYVRKKANKNDLVASAGWSDYLVNKQFKGPDYYLEHHFAGGRRKLKRFEERLISKGLMPAGYQCAIGKAADEMGLIDSRGNMKAGVIVAILSALQALSGPGSNGDANGRKRQSANKRAARNVYWAGKPGPNTPNGIWALDEKFKGGRGRLRPVLIYVKPGNYRKRLDLQKISDAVVLRTFNAEFAKEYANAMRSAR
jgi:hypothetical protein